VVVEGKNDGDGCWCWLLRMFSFLFLSSLLLLLLSISLLLFLVETTAPAAVLSWKKEFFNDMFMFFLNNRTV